VATDIHFVDDSTSVTLADGHSYSARKLLSNPQNEMAYLEIEGVDNPEKNCRGMPMSTSTDIPENVSVGVMGYQEYWIMHHRFSLGRRC